MTSNKRKRSDDVTEKLQVKKEKITSNDEEVVKKPHKEQPLVGGGPSEIFTAAIEKISELEQLINEVGGNEEEDDDYSSDYSELSDMDSGRFDNDNHGDGDEGVSNGFNPEIVGFAICAQEAMNFLSKEGFSGQNPLVLSMQKRLLDQLTDYQKSLNEPKRRKF